VIEPYVFVRAVTIGLGALWCTTALVRTLRSTREWRERLRPLAIDERWWRRQIVRVALRVTVLDPLNLALLFLLLWLWSRPLS
jgi:hypothetical protein